MTSFRKIAIIMMACIFTGCAAGKASKTQSTDVATVATNTTTEVAEATTALSTDPATSATTEVAEATTALSTDVATAATSATTAVAEATTVQSTEVTTAATSSTTAVAEATTAQSTEVTKEYVIIYDDGTEVSLYIEGEEVYFFQGGGRFKKADLPGIEALPPEGGTVSIHRLSGKVAEILDFVKEELY